MAKFFQKALRMGEGKKVKQLEEQVGSINAFEAGTEALSDEQLKAKTPEFRERLENGEDLDDILPEAYAVVREASKRVMGMRHYDVQLMGGIVLHQGKIAEMRTGEGKTLASTLPAYLNAVGGNQVHVVTVNDYLASRDADWMGPIHNFLGLSVGFLRNMMPPDRRREAYACDIVYGTNSEFGFDYLRDNMALSIQERVQRGHTFAIVDEVDNILIDEARTPLIISGAPEQAAVTYKQFAAIVPLLRPEDDYEVDEKHRTVAVTEAGVAKVEQQLGLENLYESQHGQLVNHLMQALRAHALFHKDVEYVVKDGEVLIVDEFTGRIMEGRRYSEGLHQAIEAKEGVRIREENQTLATITLQNYFRMYDKLSGMTGTAATEADEFFQIYKLEVVTIPTHMDMVRDDRNDFIYKTKKGKYAAVLEDIVDCNKVGQPVLVGTISVDTSEDLSSRLTRRGVKHVVLNAKNHAPEAEIVAQAGRKGAVTIATNMAGRGTDIMLGGNPDFMAQQQCLADGTAEEVPSGEPELIDTAGYVLFQHKEKSYRVDRDVFDRARGPFKEQTDSEHKEVVELGGLYVLGTERHESRRIDNQLRGRSGRQGDPGASRFYLSAEDDLIRLFAGDRIFNILDKLSPDESAPIEHKMLSKTVENAQKKVEQQHFQTRKRVLEYDDVMNKQREVIYEQRTKILEGDDISEDCNEIIDDVLTSTVETYCESNTYPEDWDWDSLFASLKSFYDISFDQNDFEIEEATPEEMVERVLDDAHAFYQRKEEEFSSEHMRKLERLVMLGVVDNRWREHLYDMDYLREGIHWRSLTQKDPLVEYKSEGFGMFKELLDTIKEDFVRTIFHMSRVPQDELAERRARELQYSYDDGVETSSLPQPEPAAVGAAQAAGAAGAAGAGQEPLPLVETRHADKVGRNDPCPCGSGKKYKKCCGA
ncbi:MAG: preprotein translocase subunit SecA [Actinobacteria bacterium]|nr:preprotein translocase subunit SecA [Actinomycetota bacterium]